MRQRHTTQGSIFWIRPEHEISHYLSRVEQWLAQAPEVLDWIGKDLRSEARRGRPGMGCDQVLRAALILQYRQCGYRGLEFLLKDSFSFQSFCRIDPFKVPAKSTLAANIGAVRPATWRKMNRLFMRHMKDEGFETGERLRIDSTVAETHILFPTDSKLLYDGIRLMVRTLRKLKPIVGINYVNHCRRAKKHWFAATMAKTDEQRYPHYKALWKDVDETRLRLLAALEALKTKGDRPSDIDAIEQLLALVEQVMSQSTRRIVFGESVAAEDKVVSLHEPHTDIIKKGGRDVQFGHKLNLSTGSSGLVIDITIERGNPTDTSRLIPMLKRHRRIFGEVPQSVAVDGGYASQDNLAHAKSLLRLRSIKGSTWLLQK